MDDPQGRSDENHRRFQSRNNSERRIKAEQTLAAWIESRGIPTKITGKTTAPTVHERRQHMDNGDLIHTINGRPVRGEVKGSTYVFSSRDTFRHKVSKKDLSSFIVVAVHAYDYAVPKPLYIAKLSEDYRYAAVVRSYTFANWWIQEGRDPEYIGVVERWYWVDTDLVYFVDLHDPKITFQDFLYAPPQYVERYANRIRASESTQQKPPGLWGGLA